MTKQCAIGVALFLSGFAISQATETVTLDGVWWHGLDSNSKVAAVQGMTAAYTAGYRVAENETSYRFYQKIKASNSLGDLKKLKAYASSDSASPPEFSKTFGTYVHVFDDFFANHPDRVLVEPARMIDCMSDDSKVSCDSEIVNPLDSLP